MTASTNAMASRISTSSIVISVALIVMGFLAMVLPAIPSVAIALLIGWLVMFHGFIQLAHAFQSKGIGHIAWKLLISACYIVTGILLVAHPLIGLAALTLTLAAFAFALGAVDIVSYFLARAPFRSGWMLLNGIVMLILGVIIWRRWPANSLWVLGSLVGVAMVMTGITRLMMTLTFRKLLRNAHDVPVQERWAA
jgi:uncharacterized membrane protein HdeD (DUF308 family)